MEDQGIGEQTKKQLQALMSDQRWGAVELFIADFMRRHFVQQSVKRETEFDTIWYAAEAEGGKNYISKMLAEMERAASQALD